MGSNAFLEAMKAPRSIYSVNKDIPISDKRIAEITEQVLLHSPSCFNCQSGRIVLLLNEEHETFWDFVLEVLKPILPPEQFTGFEQKIGGFKAGYGTVSPEFYVITRLLEDLMRVTPQPCSPIISV